VAGFREFVTGEVLTAANVDDFLAKQAVMKFADAAARDAALGATVGGGNALREGMVAYLDDTDDLLKYDGSSWSSVGGLVAVKSAIFQGVQSASVASGGNLTVTDLTITHEVADAANKLIISAVLGIVASTQQSGFFGLAVHDGTGFIAVGNAEGARTRTSSGVIAGSGNAGTFYSLQTSFVHTPGAGSKTYTVRVINARPETHTVFVNRSEQNINSGAEQRGMSSLVIQEVKV
jgi:hypothetical protein